MTISIRIAHLDHYMAKPGPLDRSFSPFCKRRLNKVPVIRIFGSTRAGQKVCLHVHQVYSYFYISFPISLDGDIEKEVFQFGTSLNEAMNLAKPNTVKDQHIAAIVLVKGVPFYGYHVGYQSFLKIYLTDAQEKKTMLDILQTGAIMGTPFQPFEAHLNFELQFLLDHNLYGMDWIHVDDTHGIDELSKTFGIRFRLPLLEEPKGNLYVSQNSSTHSMSHLFVDTDYTIYTAKTVPAELQSGIVSRESYCELELDITGMSILNRHDLKERSIHVDLEKEKQLQSEGSNDKATLVKSLESIWKDELSRQKSRGIKDPKLSVSQTEEREPRKPWLAEPSLRKLLNKMLAFSNENPSHHSGTESVPLSAMTAFESVEALYPEEYHTFLQMRHKPNPSKMVSITPLRSVSFSPTSSQFNVSATPTRYKTWDIPSQLDADLLNSFISEVASQEAHHNEQEGNNSDMSETEQQQPQQSQEQQDEEDYFSIDHSLSDHDIIDWLKDAEKHTKHTSDTRTIEYEQQPNAAIQYKPRKLIFLAEDRKADSILKASSPVRKRSIADIMEGVELDNKPFVISDVPPVSMRRMARPHFKKDIDQLDGSKDSKDGHQRKMPSATEKWELERKALRKMRRKQKEATIKAKQTHTDSYDSRTSQAISQIKKPVVQIKEIKPTKTSDTVNEHKPNLSIGKTRKSELKGKRIETTKPDPEKSKIKEPEIKISKASMFENKSSQNETSNGKVKWLRDEDHPSFQKVSVIIPRRKRKRKRASSAQSQAKPSDQTIQELPRATEPSDLSDPLEPKSLHLSQESTEIVESRPETFILNGTPPKALSSINQEEKQIPNQSTPFSPKKPKVAESKDADIVDDRNDTLDPVHKETNVAAIESKKSSQDDFLGNDEDFFNIDCSIPYESIPTVAESSKIENQIEDHSVLSFTSQRRMDSVREFIYNHPPPIVSQFEPQDVTYREPYFSKASDQPQFPFVFEGKEFKLPTSDLNSMQEFKTVYTAQIDRPPSTKDIKAWAKVKEEKKESKEIVYDVETQIDCPTSDNIFNFKLSASKPLAKVKHVRDHIDYFSVELHINTREQLLPNPEHDPVLIAFWCLQTKDQYIKSNGYSEEYCVGAIVMNQLDVFRIGLNDDRLQVDYADTEEQLFDLLIEKIRYYDPDMLVGYETQNSSWGYLIERGAQLGYHLVDELSRAITTTEFIQKDQWGYKKSSSYRIVGRHMLNVWRLMRNELTLTSYTLENVAYHLLHYRVPHYSYAILTNWYNNGPAILKYRLFKHYIRRVQLNLELLEASQVISRMCESARVYGIDFYAVMTRGSQYNVESVMFRIAKPENFMLISPSRAQVASQRSLEVLPLVMEPISQFYSSPIAVLDFQSLYPSIMIAYNYCYSTCLGRIRNPGEESRFGVLDEFELQDGMLEKLKDFVNVSPNGVMFVKPEVRKSLLARMLNELLDTRAMVKKAMKDYRDDSGLTRMLDAKQLSLKLLANVTYGYTSASYSGRMPSVEIADSIVASGRETLERAIRLVNETQKWGARVVYGDTDSMFVYFPGKTKEEAFKLGREIAEAVTRMNPAPVKLKFEKIYHPSVLLAKKRYVGFKYENESDTSPLFEAKGIETVRRDGTAATQKILESSLKILFRSQDMSELKEYLYRQWTKILSNRISLQDFIIAKEVRMGTYSARGGPNGAVIAQAQIDQDDRAEPQHGERVPYVVVYRGPNAKLKDKVVRPEEALTDSSLRLDAEYYIRKQIIPPLARIFNLIGADILSWYETMPRSQKTAMLRSAQPPLRSLTRIDQYYSSSYCLICHQKTDQSICAACQKDPIKVMYTLSSRQHAAQTRFKRILQTCERCTKIPTPVAMISNATPIADSPCHSLDCTVYYQRLKSKEDVNMALHYDDLIDDFC
ncbi:hypothetical protein BD560DRAFT_393226 [Blakeslea trispora]|nr:hypothetical protein BD560DRAFT_393226 [Blakeslea trispora]